MKFHLETKMPCGFLWWKTTTLSSKCLNAVEVAESQLTDFAKVFSSLVMKMFKNSGVIKIPNFEFKWTCFLLNGSWQFQTFERVARLRCILKKHGYFCKKSKKKKKKKHCKTPSVFKSYFETLNVLRKMHGKAIFQWSMNPNTKRRNILAFYFLKLHRFGFSSV